MFGKCASYAFDWLYITKFIKLVYHFRASKTYTRVHDNSVFQLNEDANFVCLCFY